MKTITTIFILACVSLPAMGQSDQIINSSINAFVPQNEESFMGFIVAPAQSGADVDIVILAEGQGGFDPVVRIFFDTTNGSPVAFNDDWNTDATNDFPANSTTNTARDCWRNVFANRLATRDSLVLLSVTSPSGPNRSVFAEVRGFNNTGGKVNLQLLQVDGPLTGTCPDF